VERALGHYWPRVLQVGLAQHDTPTAPQHNTLTQTETGNGGTGNAAPHARAPVRRPCHTNGNAPSPPPRARAPVLRPRAGRRSRYGALRRQGQPGLPGERRQHRGLPPSAGQGGATGYRMQHAVGHSHWHRDTLTDRRLPLPPRPPRPPPASPASPASSSPPRRAGPGARAAAALRVPERLQDAHHREGHRREAAAPEGGRAVGEP
jgi:hypothetical protein